MTYTTSTTTAAATRRLGEKIGRLIRGGIVIELVGDIGSGKTTLTQGIARGLGFAGEVPSPTFTVSRVYPVRDGLELHHFDWYRLSGPDVVTSEFSETAGDRSAVVVVEWAGNGQTPLPPNRLRVTLAPTADSEAQREVTVESLGGAADYITKGLGA